MQLSLDQFRLVERDVQSEGITYSHLEYDLLDHVCCDIEDRMRTGFSFDDAYHAVKLDVGLQGLRRVQQETLLLINKNYRMMKKSMKTLGTIALAGISIAALAKIMHLSGAVYLIILSFFLVSTIFFPAALYVWYKEVFNKKHAFIVIMTFFAGFTFMYGTLFKLLHWPYANILLAIGEILMILTIIIGGISYLFSKQSKMYPKGLLITGIIGLVGFSLGTLFKIQHWPGASILLLFGPIILFSIFLPIYAYHTYNKEKTVKNSFIFSVYALIFIITFTFLLALNPSKNILHGNIYRVNELHNSIVVAENQINQISGSLENSNEITQVANTLFNSISNLKKDLVIAAGGIDINVNQLKWEDLNHLKKSGLNKSSGDLLEEKANILYNDIQEYKSLLIKGFDKKSFSVDFINGVLFLKQDNAPDWIIQNFYKIPLLTTINNLTQLQLNIRLAQQEALSSINMVVAEKYEENIKE